MADSEKAGHVTTDSKKPATSRPTPRSQPPAGGLDYALKVCTNVMAMGRGVATVKPAAPESQNTHGYSTSYGAAMTRPAWHYCMLTMTSPTAGCQYAPQAAGPFSQRDTRRRPRFP